MIVKVRSTRWLSLLLSVFLVGALTTGCSDDDPVSPTPEVSEFEVLSQAVDGYTGGSQAPVVKAQELFDNINDGNASNNYFVLSVRGAGDYAKGHIPGAINIPWREIAKADKLSMLPAHQKILVYCYTGHTGGVATTLLNVLGYEAYNMKWGIMSWTKDPAARVAAPFSEATGHDFALETTVNVTGATYDLPEPNYTASSDTDEILKAAADKVATEMTPVIKAQALFDNLNDGNASNDPIVVSVRSAAHYALGHIPGSINIPWREIADENNLKKLDPSRDIVIYCYTGHTGQVAATALRLLGYKATNMKFGIMDWTKDNTVRATGAFSEATEAHEFPLNTGNTP